MKVRSRRNAGSAHCGEEHDERPEIEREFQAGVELGFGGAWVRNMGVCSAAARGCHRVPDAVQRVARLRAKRCTANPGPRLLSRESNRGPGSASAPLRSASPRFVLRCARDTRLIHPRDRLREILRGKTAQDRPPSPTPMKCTGRPNLAAIATEFRPRRLVACVEFLSSRAR